jgi:hypothetical protein
MNACFYDRVIVGIACPFSHQGQLDAPHGFNRVDGITQQIAE